MRKLAAAHSLASVRYVYESKTNMRSNSSKVHPTSWASLILRYYVAGSIRCAGPSRFFKKVKLV
jgi:hypothetical protein